MMIELTREFHAELSIRSKTWVSVVCIMNNLYVAGYAVVLNRIVPGIEVVSIATKDPTALEEVSNESAGKRCSWKNSSLSCSGL